MLNAIKKCNLTKRFFCSKSFPLLPCKTVNGQIPEFFTPAIINQLLFQWTWRNLQPSLKAFKFTDSSKNVISSISSFVLCVNKKVGKQKLHFISTAPQPVGVMCRNEEKLWEAHKSYPIKVRLVNCTEGTLKWSLWDWSAIGKWFERR